MAGRFYHLPRKRYVFNVCVYHRYRLLHKDEEGGPERVDKKEEQQQNLSDRITQHGYVHVHESVCAWAY